MCRVEAATPVYPGGVPSRPPQELGKWVYTVKAIDWPDEYAFPTQARAESGFESTSALNIWELSNDATTQYGVTVSTLPGTYELKPVPVGAFVMVWASSAKPDIQGFRLALFQYPNQFDGACA
mgnify:FL=1|tara:strand:- start:799 stop:1167 length:369 start_codon:yes stop_codon:yes gene_type:complete